VEERSGDGNGESTSRRTSMESSNLKSGHPQSTTAQLDERHAFPLFLDSEVVIRPRQGSRVSYDLLEGVCQDSFSTLGFADIPTEAV
jgi:hypothetical protein